MKYAQFPKLATMTVLFACALGAAEASTDKFPPCGTFTIHGSEFEVVPLDLAQEGRTVGDERIGERELKDADGNVVGVFRWVSTVVDTEGGDGDDTIALNHNVYTLPDGTIHASGQFFFETFMNRNTQPETNPAESKNSIAVTGGTGAYVNSEGEVEAAYTPGEPSKYIFKLQCD